MLHIRGRGFGNLADAVLVDIAGMPCNVLTATDYVIVCSTSPWESSVSSYSSFQGGAGVNLTKYTGAITSHKVHRCDVLSKC